MIEENLPQKRIELESARALVGVLFENHKEEFFTTETGKNAIALRFNIESFDFFFARGNYSRALSEANQAFENYRRILA